jgi:hypothetical protein
MSRSHECERCTHECVRHRDGQAAGGFGRVAWMRVSERRYNFTSMTAAS